MDKMIYLSPPELSEAELKLLSETLDSNWVAPVGPNLKAFESAIMENTGAHGCSALNSGTAAIHLALRLLEIGKGDVVFTSTHTHIGAVSPIVQRGALPVFIDVEKESWNMDVQVLEDTLRDLDSGKQKLPGISWKDCKKVILPVHIYGMPSDMASIGKLAEKYSMEVIEDAAEALGSEYNGIKAGCHGKIGIYSFNGNKIITTGGGGALVSQSEAIAERATYLATQARKPLPYYQHEEIAYNYRLSNVLAAIGLAQIRDLDRRVSTRRDHHERYRSYFQKWNERGFDIRFQEEADEAFSNRWLTGIVIRPDDNKGLTNETIRTELEKDNIESRYMWKPMHLQPVFQKQPYFGGRIADDLFLNGLCLPSGSGLADEDFQRIFKNLDTIFSDLS